MKNRRISLYRINTLTPLHVGSGSNNIGVIDNLVQRDPISNFPTINGSSLKGALREHFTGEYENSSNHTGVDAKSINHIFGHAPIEKEDNESYGHFKFLQSNLIAIPVRSTEKPFMMGICKGTIEQLVNDLEAFSIEEKLLGELRNLLKIIENNVKERNVYSLSEIVRNNVYVEELELKAITEKSGELSLVKKLIGEEIVIFHDEDFKEITNELPVIARNKLNNGKSENLWFEEVVPRESKFYTIIIQEENEENTSVKTFDKIVLRDIIQIGANGSVGYGFCKISKGVE